MQVNSCIEWESIMSEQNWLLDENMVIISQIYNVKNNYLYIFMVMLQFWSDLSEWTF